MEHLNVSNQTNWTVLGEDEELCGCKTLCACYVVTSLIVTLITVTTISLNCVCLYVFIKSQELRNFHGTYFLISLTVADLGIGLVSQTTGTILAWTRPQILNSPQWIIRVVGFCSRVFDPVALTTLACVSVVKLISIKLPLKYELIVTPWRCCVVAIVVWISVIIPNLIITIITPMKFDLRYFDVWVLYSNILHIQYLHFFVKLCSSYHSHISQLFHDLFRSFEAESIYRYSDWRIQEQYC